MNVARDPSGLDPRQRAVAIGVFDGVHLGHQAVLQATVDTGLVATAITFDPHPRLVLGYGVELLATLERRLELFEEAGIEETLVLEFTHDLQQQNALGELLGLLLLEVVRELEDECLLDPRLLEELEPAR